VIQKRLFITNYRSGEELQTAVSVCLYVYKDLGRGTRTHRPLPQKFLISLVKVSQINLVTAGQCGLCNQQACVGPRASRPKRITRWPRRAASQ